jgi:hypothetical protein
VAAFDQDLGTGVGRLADQHLRTNVPRNAWHSPVSSTRPARDRPIAPSPSRTSTRGIDPRRSISCHQPANRSCELRVGINTADNQRE